MVSALDIFEENDYFPLNSLIGRMISGVKCLDCSEQDLPHTSHGLNLPLMLKERAPRLYYKIVQM